MARIIVTAEQGELLDAPVLLDERVRGAHLRDGHSAGQLIQRLGWAVADAEEVERESDRIAYRRRERAGELAPLAHDQRK